MEEAYITWSGEWETIKEIDQPHETEMLQLSIDKTVTQLEWKPKWDFNKTVQKTMSWV